MIEDQLALLPEYLGNHMLLTLTALAIGISISLPLAIVSTRWKRLEWPVLGVASILQTIPALALLALMVPLLGRIGFLPALLALILYSMLPILRNTVTGISGVDPSLVEAAQAIGMTDRQLLWKVQLPLAAPMIIAGIRIASVWVVGIATLSTPVGAPSLGNYIFSGLQTQNFTAVMVGVVAAATLAVAIDLLIRLLETAVTRRSRPLLLASVTGLLLLIAGAIYPAQQEIMGESRPVRWVGAKTFTEQYVLASLMESMLSEAGFQVEGIESLGSTVIFEALASSRIDCYVDYSGTIWANHMKRTETPSRQEVLKQMTAWLDREYGIRCLGSLGFENAYALAMRRDQARNLGIVSVADLTPHSPKLSIGGDYEFFSRPEWRSLRDAYGLDFLRKRSFDSTLMYSAVQAGEVDVISAFSTDGRLLAYDLEVLEEPLQVLPPYDGVLLLSPRTSEDARLIQALKGLISGISNQEMRTANKMVDLDRRSVEEAARWLRQQLSD